MRMKPYRKIEELPPALRNELPEAAQRLYLAVYQRTWETCAMGGDGGAQDFAGTAHEAAMLAVQGQFDKDERGDWQQSSVGDEIDSDKLEGTAPDVAKE